MLVSRTAACAIVVALLCPAAALARGGSFAVVGGTPAERAQVRAALDASSFDWSTIPAVVQVHIAPGVSSYATPGAVWLDANLLHAGVFSWAVVQDEFAHQVDWFLLDDAQRDLLNAALGTRYWCHADRPGLAHSAYGCERFTSTFVWAYWPSPRNAYRPANGEVAMAPWRFRTLLDGLLHPTAPLPPVDRGLFGAP